jgi:hypothetical protein
MVMKIGRICMGAIASFLSAALAKRGYSIVAILQLPERLAKNPALYVESVQDLPADNARDSALAVMSVLSKLEQTLQPKTL